jgi:hypothetical protein
VRNKYENTTAGVLNWESALMKQAAGEFNMTVGGRTLDAQTQINIVDPSHPLAAGLSGTVTVTTSPLTMSFGTGDLGAGVSLVAQGVTDPLDRAITGRRGDALLGMVRRRIRRSLPDDVSCSSCRLEFRRPHT